MRNRNNFAVIMALVSVVCLLCTMQPAHAQTKWPGVSFSGGAKFPSASRPAASAAEVGYTRISAKVKALRFSSGEPTQIRQSKNAASLPFGSGGAPFSQLLSVPLGSQGKFGWGEKLDWTVLFGTSSSFDENISDSPGAVVMGGLSYNYSPDLVITGGLFGSYHQLRSNLLPWIGLSFRPGAKKGVSGTLGFPVSKITMHLNPRHSLSFSGGYEKRTYELVDNYTVDSGGYFQDSSYMLGLDYTANINPDLSLGFGAEYLFNREFTYYDSLGEEKEHYQVDDSLGVYLKVVFRF